MPVPVTVNGHLKCRVPVSVEVPGAGVSAGQIQPAAQVPGASAGLRCRVQVPVPVRVNGKHMCRVLVRVNRQLRCRVPVP